MSPVNSLLSHLGKTLRGVIAVVAAVLVVASFAWVAVRPWRGVDTGGSTIELTLMHWGAKDEQAIVDEITDRFEQQHPHIRVRCISAPGEYERKLQTMTAAGVPPDVFFLESDDVPKYASKGLIENIEPWLAAEDQNEQPRLQLDDFYEPVLNAFRTDGSVSGRGPLYGLPMSFTTVGFYYNRALFARAGLGPPADDWTWDDFLKAARAIGKLEDCYGAEFLTWEMMVRTYLWTQGVEMFGDDYRTANLDNPRLHTALELIRRWRFEEARTLTSGQSRVALGTDLFVSGRVGMIGPLGRWQTPPYRRQSNLDWDFAALPRGPERANVVFTSAWVVSTRSEYPEAAWQLVRHLTSPLGQRLTAESGLAIPARRSVAESVAFRDPSVRPRRDDLFLKMVPHARPVVWPPDTRYPTLFRDQFEACLKYGTKSVDAALAELKRAVARIEASPLRQHTYPRVRWGWAALLLIVPIASVKLVVLMRWWRRRPGRVAFREELAGMAFISPWVTGFLCITAFPIILSLLLAFSTWSGLATIDHARWVGFGNFVELLRYDTLFHKSLVVTIYYAALAVPLSQLAALGAALLMNQEVRGIGFYRSAWYLPSVLAGVGVAVLWKWVFDGEHGLLNRLLDPLLAMVGLDAPDWLGRDAGLFGPPAFAIMHLWMIGGAMMIYLAGLGGIPKTLYEAAEIDGAGPLRRFGTVTVPMLSPVIFFNTIMAIITSFQVFTQAYVMTEGGPDNATMFYVLYLYKQAFEFHEMGYASAMAWLLLLIILALTLLVMRGSRRYVYYEGLRA